MTFLLSPYLFPCREFILSSVHVSSDGRAPVHKLSCCPTTVRDNAGLAHDCDHRPTTARSTHHKGACVCRSQSLGSATRDIWIRNVIWFLFLVCIATPQAGWWGWGLHSKVGVGGGWLCAAVVYLGIVGIVCSGMPSIWDLHLGSSVCSGLGYVGLSIFFDM